MLHLGLLLAAFIVFLLAAFVPVATRINLMAIGLALFTLSFIVVGH